MTIDTALKAFALWLVILVLAVANGGVREAVLIPRFGHASGLILSGVLLSGCVLLVAYLGVPWLRARGAELGFVGSGAWAMEAVRAAKPSASNRGRRQSSQFNGLRPL